MSRESNGGRALDKNGLGDNGNGFGLMQVISHLAITMLKKPKKWVKLKDRYKPVSVLNVSSG